MQQRNIEEATEHRVIDRTQLILDILRSMRGAAKDNCRWSWRS